MGRIKCGTESNGGFRNITIANCVFDYCCGLALEAVDGGGLQDIMVSKLTLRDVQNAPLFICVGSRLRAPERAQVSFARRISITNVVAHNVAPQAGILICGDPVALVEDIRISNVLIESAGGGTNADAQRVVPELGRDYPERKRFGRLPAWGVVCTAPATWRLTMLCSVRLRRGPLKYKAHGRSVRLQLGEG